MAKPIEYIVQLSEAESIEFIRKVEANAPNPARDELFKRARGLQISLKDI